ncbi:MAG: hypothetical protein V3R91_06800 [Myxococcota bacterium]
MLSITNRILPLVAEAKGLQGARRSILIGALAVALAACGESFGERAARIESGLIGLDSRHVIRCMGPPEDLNFEDETHGLWVYVRPLEETPGFAEDPDPASSPPGWGDLRSRTSDRNLRDLDAKREQEFLANPTVAAIAPGYCLLKFEVDDGRIRSFEAQGRSHAGMRANSRCALIARYCVE